MGNTVVMAIVLHFNMYKACNIVNKTGIDNGRLSSESSDKLLVFCLLSPFRYSLCVTEGLCGHSTGAVCTHIERTSLFVSSHPPFHTFIIILIQALVPSVHFTLLSQTCCTNSIKMSLMETGQLFLSLSSPLSSVVIA